MKKPEFGDWFNEDFEELRIEDLEREMREHAEFNDLDIDFEYESLLDYFLDYWEQMDIDGDDDDAYSMGETG